MRSPSRDFSAKGLFGKYTGEYWWGGLACATGAIRRRNSMRPMLQTILLRSCALSKLGPEHRSYLPISRADLLRLAAIAAADRADYFARYPDWADLYAGRVLCTALCQGAALHYLYGAAGIQDFDVYTFYAEHPGRPWYARRRAVYDFGDPKFGQSADRPHFVGRRVDVWGRAIPAEPGDPSAQAVRAYLALGVTETARRLAQKAVVLLQPAAELGTTIWP